MKGTKRLGRKKRRKGISKKSLHRILLVLVIVSILLISISLYIYFPPHSPSNQTFQFKAAIVDHLSISQPNQAFVQKATNILKEAGFTVDYYPGENVTVEFYRNLLTHGYGLIVLRVHSGLRDGTLPPVAFFTSEPYNTKDYIPEQLTGQVIKFHFRGENLTYFGILPDFVRLSMKGNLHNTTIIMMGCDGLVYTEMAQAFIEKGAKVYISWNGPVSASHTDQATTRLLEHLITEKQTIDQAVGAVGPDPTDNSTLQYYPNEAGKYTYS